MGATCLSVFRSCHSFSPDDISWCPNKKLTGKKFFLFTLLDIQKISAEIKERIIKHINETLNELSSEFGALETTIVEVKALEVPEFFQERIF